MELFDTHAHLSDEAFDEDRHSLIPKLFESGVTRIIDVACDVRTADRTIELIDRYPFIYGTVGMHPHDVSAMDNAMMDRISDILQHKKMLALGEIGLDYHYDLSPRDCQRKWFAEQLELAKQLECDTEAVLGYRDGQLFLKSEFDEYAHVTVATEDGSVGTKGNVLDAVRENNITGDVIFACGPTPMLRAIKEYAVNNNIPCYVSLEEKMACGIGACLACVCKSTEKDEHSQVNNKRVCKEGPVFDVKEVEL